MAQHDLRIQPARGDLVLADMNQALVALATLQSGPELPLVSYPYQLAIKTSTNEVWQQNGSNTGWTLIGRADQPGWGHSGGGGGGISLFVQDEGVTVGTATDTLNFTGSGVAVTGAGPLKTIIINGPPSATEQRTGVVRFSTSTEAQAGTRDDLATSPATVWSAVNSWIAVGSGLLKVVSGVGMTISAAIAARNQVGVSRLATDAETQGATEQGAVVTPSAMWSGVKSWFQAGDNITLTINETTRRIRVAAAGGVDDAELQGLIDILFDEPVSWTFTASLSENGQAVVSTGNTAMFGSTVFLALQYANAAAATAFIGTVAANNGVLIIVGTTAILAEVAGVRADPSNPQVAQVWLGTELWTKGLDSYGEVGTGTGTVQIWRGASDTPAASETVAGKAEVATTAETTTGTDDGRIVTPLKLRQNVGTQISASEITAATETAPRRTSPSDLKSFVDTHGGDIDNSEFAAILDLLAFGDPSIVNWKPSVTVTGDATVSPDNTPKFGTDTFVALKLANNKAAQTIQDNLIAEDGVWLNDGATAQILAKVAGVDIVDPPNDDVLRIWVGSELWTTGLDRWGEFTRVGAGSIRFFRSIQTRAAQELPSVPARIFGFDAFGRLGNIPTDDLAAHIVGPTGRLFELNGTWGLTANGALPNTARFISISGTGNSRTVNITGTTTAADRVNQHLQAFVASGYNFTMRISTANSGGWRFKIGSPVNVNSIANGGWGFTALTISGTPPTNTVSTYKLLVDGDLVRWEEFFREGLKPAIKAGSNITITANDTDETLTIDSNIYSANKDILVAGNGVTLTASDSAETVTITASGPTVSTVSNVGETYTDLVTGLSDNNFVQITIEGAWSNETNNIVVRTVAGRFQDFSTSDRWISIRGGEGGGRFMIKRVASGGKLQIRRAGAIASTNTIRAYVR